MAKRRSKKKAADGYALVKPGKALISYLTVGGKTWLLNHNDKPVTVNGTEIPVPDQAVLKSVYEAGYTSIVRKVNE
jgi:hypothetical protein